MSVTLAGWMQRCTRALACGAMCSVLACNQGAQPQEPSESAPAEAKPSTAASASTSARDTRDLGAKSDTKPSAEPEEPAPDGEPTHSVIHTKSSTGEVSAIDVAAPAGWEVVRAPTAPDPHGGKFTIKQATEGLKGSGTLVAQIETSMGSFYCDLLESEAPSTVANFVGLARGKRKFWDDKLVEWTARPYYDGTTFHRVIPGFMIQGGDHTLTGNGRIGYTFGDEVPPGKKHDRGGQLCMANRGRGMNEAQFFITERASPHIDGSYTIFGQCEPIGLVQRIARVAQSGPPLNRPKQDVVIKHVEIKRVPGGIAKWMPQSAKMPALPGVVPSGRAVQVQEPSGAAPAQTVPVK